MMECQICEQYEATEALLIQTNDVVGACQTCSRKLDEMGEVIDSWDIDRDEVLE